MDDVGRREERFDKPGPGNVRRTVPRSLCKMPSRDGPEWSCSGCGNVNLGDCLGCVKCREPRSGNWTCGGCQSLNWRESLGCYQCCAVSPLAWHCEEPGCGHVNYPERRTCQNQHRHRQPGPAGEINRYLVILTQFLPNSFLKLFLPFSNPIPYQL